VADFSCVVAADFFDDIGLRDENAFDAITHYSHAI